MHPKANGAAFGAASHQDFLRLANICSKLDRGVYLNWGSAVVAPEVFVKAHIASNGWANMAFNPDIACEKIVDLKECTL